MAQRTPHADRLTQWVTDHAQAVRGYLLGLVHDAHVADDLLQEVFVRTWAARLRYTEQGKPRAYLLRIADRLACDWARRRGHEQRLRQEQYRQLETPTPDDQPLGALLGAESRRQLTEALDTLSEGQRRTLLLRYYGELDFNEIARIMDCPTNTVLSHARRGLVALRRLLTEKVE